MGNWIAFSLNQSLAIVRPDGLDLRVLWQGPQGVAAPVPQWSPDSQHIVFLAEDGSLTRTVRVIAIQTERPETITRTASIIPCNTFETAAFSPDGSQIAYFNDACDPVLISADGSSQPTRNRTFSRRMDSTGLSAVVRTICTRSGSWHTRHVAA